MSRPERHPRRLPTADLPGAGVAAIAFGIVLVATALTFAFSQRLKRAPPLVYEEQRVALFSPKVPGEERARFSFKLHTGADRLTILITNLAGDPIRTIVEDRPYRFDGERVYSSWNGADDRGRLAPDGRYRVRVVLKEAGRAVQLPFTLTLDTTPPAPKVLSIGPEQSGPGGPRPELLPRADGRPVRVRYRVGETNRSKTIHVFRTDLVRPREILRVPITDDSGRWDWDGTIDGAGGRRVAQGTYVIAVSAKDLVGNQGWSTGNAEQVAPFGGKLEGAGGVTVRYLAAQSPQAPVLAGERAEIGVISAGKQYDWSLRRVGERRVRSRGESRRVLLRPKLPGGPSGLHVLDVRTADRTAQATVLTQSQTRQPVLVVIPAATLTGSALVDDDGDGAPDTLARGVSAQSARVPVDAELPVDLADRIAPLLVALDRKDRRYDLTTDLALARGTGPQLAGHRGVVLAGTHQYLDTRAQRRLVTWVKRGGRLWIAEPDSLRRSVQITGGAITRPTQPTRLDPFGFELGPLQEVSAVVQSTSNAGLLRGTDGRFDGPLTVEPVLRIPTGARRIAEATTPGGGQPVLVAVQLERGAVIRSGISGLGASANRDPDAREFLRRLWIYLRGGG